MPLKYVALDFGQSGIVNHLGRHIVPGRIVGDLRFVVFSPAWQARDTVDFQLFCGFRMRLHGCDQALISWTNRVKQGGSGG